MLLGSQTLDIENIIKKGVGYMKIPLYCYADIQRGTALSDNEKRKPKDMTNIKPVKVLTYSNFLTLEQVLDLKNTINEDTIEKDDVAYIKIKNEPE